MKQLSLLNVHPPPLLLSTAILYNSTGTEKCFDMYAEYTPCSDPTGCGNMTTWDYQVGLVSPFILSASFTVSDNVFIPLWWKLRIYLHLNAEHVLASTKLKMHSENILNNFALFLILSYSVLVSDKIIAISCVMYATYDFWLLCPEIAMHEYVKINL